MQVSWCQAIGCRAAFKGEDSEEQLRSHLRLNHWEPICVPFRRWNWSALRFRYFLGHPDGIAIPVTREQYELLLEIGSFREAGAPVVVSKEEKVLCCGFSPVTGQPTATEFITAATARQRNRVAAKWPEGIFSRWWLPVGSVARVFAAFPGLDRLTHISNGPGYQRGICCSHRSMPERWNYRESP